MAAPTLQDYQYWFGRVTDTGITFGKDTNYDVVRVEGLESLDVRSGSRDIPREDGAIPGLHTMAPKLPIFDIEAFSDADFYDLKAKTNILPTEEAELHWKYPGRGQVFMKARVMRRNDSRDGLTLNLFPMTIAFEVNNPRIYGKTLRSRTLNVYDAAGEGIEWGIDWDVNFTVFGGGGGDVVANNAGNITAWPIIYFYGPTTGTCLGVKLENLTTGKELEINAAILTGQILTANMEARKTGSGARIIDLNGS